MAALDRNILSALMKRNRFRSLRQDIPAEMVDQNTVAMLGWFDLYFHQYPEHEHIDLDALLTLIQLRLQAGPDVMAQMRHLIGLLRVEPAQEIIAGVVNQLEELRLSGEAAALVMRFNTGEEVDLPYELEMLARGARTRMERTGEGHFDQTPIEELLAASQDESGLQFTSFPILMQNLRGLQPGDNIAVAAPTDKGKTSLLMRICADWAVQAKTMYPDRPLLYLVNEGTAKRLRLRFYQTALESTIEELTALSNSGKLALEYEQVVGRWDAVRFVDIHQKNIAQVDRIIEQHSPYAVVTDMTGRIRSNANKSGGMNDIGQLEDVWNSVRELASMRDFVHMGTVQVSAEGFNMLYPPLSALQNSKTGIQTTLDLALIMGALEDVNMRNLRGLHTPKNKLARSGKPGLTQVEMNFRPERNQWQ